MIEGRYEFTIDKRRDEDDGSDYYAASLIDNEGGNYNTYGSSEEDIFKMTADCFLTVKEIPCSRWSRFWHQLLRLG